MLATQSTLRGDNSIFRHMARAALIAPLLMATPTAAAESDRAQGAYRLSDGGVIDVAAASEGALRWRGLDGASGELKRDGDHWAGTTGWTGRPDGLTVRFDCAAKTKIGRAHV